MNYLTDALLQLLLELYKLTGNLGWSIVGFTILIRFILVPLSLPAMKLQKKMQELKPEVDKLSALHKDDKKAFQAAQLDLYKRYNVNPLSGCLPQIVQIFFLILLYNVLTTFLTLKVIDGVSVNTSFFWLDLASKDSLFIIPFLAGFTQLILSVMVLPGGETLDLVPNDSKNKKIAESNKKEENTADMAAMMQKQMVIMMPIMTGFIAIGFPSGLGVYWVVTTIFSIVQQYITTGWGGIALYTQRSLRLIRQRMK